MIDAALDTSMGFALAFRRDGQLLASSHIPGMGRESDRVLLPWLTGELGKCGLKITDIARWTLGTGPGSFAGLRCGIAMVKGIALVSGASLRGVPSSLAIAAGLAPQDAAAVGVLHDGRCNQVLFAQAVRNASGCWRLAGAPEVLNPEELNEPSRTCDVYATLQAAQLPPLPEEVTARLHCADALDAARLLEASEDDYPWPSLEDEAAVEKSVEPLYVRQAVFVKPAELRK